MGSKDNNNIITLSIDQFIGLIDSAVGNDAAGFVDVLDSMSEETIYSILFGIVRSTDMYKKYKDFYIVLKEYYKNTYVTKSRSKGNNDKVKSKVSKDVIKEVFNDLEKELVNDTTESKDRTTNTGTDDTITDSGGVVCIVSNFRVSMP